MNVANDGKKVLDDGPFYHGTKADLKPGDLLVPGYGRDFAACTSRK